MTEVYVLTFRQIYWEYGAHRFKSFGSSSLCLKIILYCIKHGHAQGRQSEVHVLSFIHTYASTNSNILESCEMHRRVSAE